MRAPASSTLSAVMLPLLLAPLPAAAGRAAPAAAHSPAAAATPSSPVTLHEVEVVSCERLDTRNAAPLVRGSGADASAELRPLVAAGDAWLLGVKKHLVRTIRAEDRSPAGWRPDDGAWLVERSRDARLCRKREGRVVFAEAPAADCTATPARGWCVIRAPLVGDVPSALARFAVKGGPDDFYEGGVTDPQPDPEMMDEMLNHSSFNLSPTPTPAPAASPAPRP